MIIKVKGCGLHLANSILSLDRSDSDRLSFFSSAWVKDRPYSQRMITTLQTSALLFRHNKNLDHSLTCPYRHHFSIADYDLELLASGSILGGSSLSIKKEKLHLLYAPTLRTKPLLTADPIDIYVHDKVNTLLLGAWYDLEAQYKEMDFIIELILKIHKNNRLITIVCESLSVAPEIIAHLSRLGYKNFAGHSQIKKISKIYKKFKKLPEDIVISSSTDSSPFLFWPWDQLNHLKHLDPKSTEWLIIQDHINSSPSPINPSIHRIVYRHFDHIEQLKKTIHIMEVDLIYLYGPFANNYKNSLSLNSSVKIKTLYPKGQPSLL